MVHWIIALSVYSSITNTQQINRKRFIIFAPPTFMACCQNSCQFPMFLFFVVGVLHKLSWNDRMQYWVLHFWMASSPIVWNQLVQYSHNVYIYMVYAPLRLTIHSYLYRMWIQYCKYIKHTSALAQRVILYSYLIGS